MATVRFINGRYRTLTSVKRLIDYVLRLDKTQEELKGGIYCNPDTTYEEFILTKALHNKLPEETFSKHQEVIHMSLNFKGWEATPELAKKIAEEFLGNWHFKGFQIVYAVHTDTDDIHVQFAINSVNYDTGKRWHSPRGTPEKLIEYSNEICSKYGLSTVKLKNKDYDRSNRLTRHLSSGEYRAQRNGRSWKAETLYAGMAAKRIARSREEFIELMERAGYKVIWEESRKDITFITPQIRKDGKHNKINSDKLGFPKRNYTPLTKEALEKQFALNRQVKENDNKIVLEYQDRVAQLFNLAHKITSSSPNEHPFQKALLNAGSKDGQALKDFISEMDKGKGIDWERD